MSGELSGMSGCNGAPGRPDCTIPVVQTDRRLWRTQKLVLSSPDTAAAKAPTTAERPAAPAKTTTAA